MARSCDCHTRDWTLSCSLFRFVWLCPPPSPSPVSQLHAQIPSIVKALHRQLRDKSVKTRQGCFVLLTALVNVLPGALDEHVGSIVPGILYSLRWGSWAGQARALHVLCCVANSNRICGTLSIALVYSHLIILALAPCPLTFPLTFHWYVCE